MSFVEKNYKNGDTLFANDLNNLVSGIKETKNGIAAKANANDVFTKTEVTEALEAKANVADVYTKVEVNNALAEKANVADVYSKAEVDAKVAKVATVFRYCGVVNAISDLPKDNNLVGDAYKVLEDKNVYAWNGTSWDNLGEDVDLTPYLTKEEAAKAYATVDTTANIELQLETKLAVTDADKKFALKTELPDVSGFATTAVVDEKIKTAETAVNAQLSLKANIAVEGDMLVVNSKIAELEQKILNLSKTNIVEETISADANYNQPDADLVITGGDQAITEKTDIVAKSISLNQATAENAVLSAVASSGSISMQNFSNSGDLPKSTSNAAVKLNSNDTVIINKSNFSQTGYNSVEIGLNNTAPKSISIDGLDFTAPLSNNAILIFAHAKDAVINISNCHFADVSNALRLSNRLNVPATVNIVNCTVDKWDSHDKWAGFLIMEDYTSNTAEDAIAAKRFTNLTINFVNVKGPGGKLIKPDDIASICGTNNAAQQVIYVYHDADDEVKPYSSGLYPKMTFA